MFFIDWISSHFPNHLLVDSHRHYNYFKKLLNLKKEYSVIPIGFDEEKINYQTPAFIPIEPFKIVFLGNIIPLQGIDVIIEAARMLERQSSIFEFHIFAPEY